MASIDPRDLLLTDNPEPEQESENVTPTDLDKYSKFATLLRRVGEALEGGEEELDLTETGEEGEDIRGRLLEKIRKLRGANE